MSYETKPMVQNIDIDISTQETHYSWSNCDWAYDRCYYKIEIATLMPPTNHLWATKANMDTDQIQITFGPQKPTWIQTKYKLPLDHRANMDTGQVQITFGPKEPTRVQVKSYHLWATKSNQRIKTDIGPQYRAEFDEFCNFNAWTKYIRKTQASVKKVRSDKETTCNNCPGVYCVKLSNKLNTEGENPLYLSNTQKHVATYKAANSRLQATHRPLYYRLPKSRAPRAKP